MSRSMSPRFSSVWPMRSDEQGSDGTSWSAEDVLVRPYGNSAALTFRLVGRSVDGELARYRNSAMFMRRDGGWRAVTWQATRIAEAPTP